MAVLIVAGVSGSGKTSVGREVARRRGCRFLDGDDLHSAENIEKMRAGRPLTDADRQGWLARIHDEIMAAERAGDDLVIACSALTRAYREQLLEGASRAAIVFLSLTETTARERVASRAGSFFPPSLVASQFELVEPPTNESRVFALDADRPLESVIDEAARIFDGASRKN